MCPSQTKHFPKFLYYQAELKISLKLKANLSVIELFDKQFVIIFYIIFNILVYYYNIIIYNFL